MKPPLCKRSIDDRNVVMRRNILLVAIFHLARRRIPYVCNYTNNSPVSKHQTAVATNCTVLKCLKSASISLNIFALSSPS